MGTFEFLIGVTGVILVAGAVFAYHRTTDILHVLLFLGPMFFYATVVDPWTVKPLLDRFFVEQSDVILVLVLNLLGVAALVAGALHEPPVPGGNRHARRRSLQDHERRQLRLVGAVLSVVAVAAYASGIVNSGGFVAAFSQAKGGGQSESGYIGEAMNLGLVGAVMAALSQYRRRWNGATFAIAALGLLPNLIQGTFGGRRGPLFLALACALLTWIVTRPRRPSLWVVASALACVLLSVVFIGSQRKHLYLGSEQAEVRWEQFFQTWQPEELAAEGNNFLYATGFVVATRHSGEYTWGRKLAVNLLVRPIPRQLWPTKYQDTGATWVTNEYPGLGHLTLDDWVDGVGWIPLAGSAGLSISDLFGEFGWGAIIAMYLIGRGFSWLRFLRSTRGGVWELVYLEALTLSIYLATQSFSAFYHRFLILAIPTIIVWKLLVKRPSQRPVVPAIAKPQLASR